ncbi:MAG: hypothetical protein M3N32_04850 [Actinomycetota bacterium]|nr:hypothetical protein [Actinomycetota bacterium]
MSDMTGRAGGPVPAPPGGDAILRGYLREHLAVAAGLAAAAIVAAIVLVGSLVTLRRVEAHSVRLPGIVVEQLPAGTDGWERLRVTYSVPDEEADAAVTVADADDYRVGQRVDLLIDPRLHRMSPAHPGLRPVPISPAHPGLRPVPAQPVLASELPEPWLAGVAASLALAASMAIAVRSTRWVRRLRRLVYQQPPEVLSEAVMSAHFCESRGGASLKLSEVDDPAPASVVVFPLMASQQELVEQDGAIPVTVRWDPADPAAMVAMTGGRVLWPRGPSRHERGAVTPQQERASPARRGPAEGSESDQAGSMPDRPASTMNDVRVSTGAPGRET